MVEQEPKQTQNPDSDYLESSFLNFLREESTFFKEFRQLMFLPLKLREELPFTDFGQSSVIPCYEVDGVFYFSKEDVVWAFLDQLAERIRSRFSFDTSSLKVWYEDKFMLVYGFPEGKSVAVNTDGETEEDLLGKVEKLGKEVSNMAGRPVEPYGPHHPPPPPHHGHPPPPPGPGPEEHHSEVMDALDRIEVVLARIEQKLE